MSLASDKTNARQRQQGGIGETIKIVVQALLLALVVRTLLFQPFNIPSGSMKDTLLIGDYLFVSKYAYGYSRFSLPFSPPIFKGRFFATPPQRGDIAVFKLPKDNATDYIKRVIGLPGDRIQMIDGRLHINGRAVQREKLPDIVTRNAFGIETRVARWQETLPNDVSYETLDLDPNSFEDNTPVYEVPAGHYFMMGDNRDNSTDSRVLGAVGYVPFENLIGRAEIIFFSVSEGERAWTIWKWPWTVRFERIFKLL